ncbi:MAG: rRNA maturation RNAse YbeY [Planctomycetota bacterium]|jgi:ssRNA-specific RNase YbeY (16S rRNA maturation enzyme)
MKVTDTTTQRTALSTDDGDGSAADTDTPPEPAEPPASAAKRAPDALAERLEVQRLPGDNPHNLSVNERWLHDRLVSALAHVARPVERITVTIVGDEKMRALNQTHRAVSDTTDVLSFERRGNDDAIEADIVICADEAARRANEDFEAMHVEEDRILTAIGVGPTFARDSSGHDDRRQPKIVTEGPAVD